MTARTLLIKFDLKDPVVITPLGVKGRVQCIFFACKGIEYKVRYFGNCEAHEEYFYEDELEPAK